MATGGAQKVLLDQAHWFHQRGHKVFAVFLYDKEGFQSKWQAVSDFPIIDLKAFQKGRGGLVNGISLVKGLYCLWRLLRREKIDAIETFTYDSNILGLSVAWLAGVPVRIATHHGVIESLSLWRVWVHSQLINLGIANILVAVSETTKKNAILEGIKPEKVIVISNGILPVEMSHVNRRQIRKEAGIAESDIYLVSVGRLVYEKGHEFLIRAIPAVLSRFPNVKAGIYGDGVLRRQLENLIHELRLSNVVKIYGFQSDVSGFLSSADVFVLPSRSEGLPIALLEAMSAGLPVVATKVGGIEEVIVDAKYGLLVPAENPEALAESIITLLNDSEMQKRIGAAAQALIIQNYDTNGMCLKYYELMLKFLNNK